MAAEEPKTLHPARDPEFDCGNVSLEICRDHVLDYLRQEGYNVGFMGDESHLEGFDYANYDDIDMIDFGIKMFLNEPLVTDENLQIFQEHKDKNIFYYRRPVPCLDSNPICKDKGGVDNCGPENHSCQLMCFLVRN
jgi:hypothetical protein